MRDNRPVMTALFESAMAAGPASGALWERLAADTGMLREHLEYLKEQGSPLPGDPALIAAAIAGLLSMLAYALLPATPGAPVSGGPGYSDPNPGRSHQSAAPRSGRPRRLIAQ
jgi:hypothetical protein